mmetsp:Transcript_26013/g.46219  ORF Transcript_26013/g.46219 Transcript_26013/m.46219 type:complete len:398 (+) Transcript_26013:75-1268(+)
MIVRKRKKPTHHHDHEEAAGRAFGGVGARFSSAAYIYAKVGAMVPKKYRRHVPLILVLAALFVLLPMYWAWVTYQHYGVNYFIPVSFQRLQNTPLHWQTEILPDKKIMMIGGPHRGGTTILWKALTEHPKIADFGDTKNTAIAFSEGVLMQDVFPKMGLGLEWSEHSVRKNQHPWKTYKGGLGQYALLPENEVHLDETSALVTPQNQAKLLNRYGYFWNLSRPILLEKSPTNAVMSRFLQALLNQGIPGAWNLEEGGGESIVWFVFTTRHPIANALAHRAWSFCREMPLLRIIQNWLRINQYMREDVPYLQNVKSIKMEDLQSHPDEIISEIFRWIGLDPNAYERKTKIKNNTNKKYMKKYCKYLLLNPGFHEELTKKYGKQIESFGYSLKEWGQCT